MWAAHCQLPRQPLASRRGPPVPHIASVRFDAPIRSAPTPGIGCRAGRGGPPGLSLARETLFDLGVGNGAPTPISRLPLLRPASTTTMVRLTVRPHLNISEKQDVSGGAKAMMDHGNAQWSLSMTDAAMKGGDIMEGMRVGMR